MRGRLGLLARSALSTLAVVLVGAASAHSADGVITTFAGSSPGFAGDGGPATSALLDGPTGVAVLADGSVLIADSANDRIRRVTSAGTITTAAGGAVPGGPGNGDGGPAPFAELDGPRDVIAAADGGYDIADTGNDRIRHVAPDGTITTIAGTVAGFAGDGGPATAARLDQPWGLARAADGGLLVADSGNGRIRHIRADGTIVTVAGTTPGFSGDNGPATAARLSAPRRVVAAPGGALLVADAGNGRVRRIGADGTITTVAGAVAGAPGPGEPALRTALRAPADILPIGPNGGYLVADAGGDRIVRVTPLGAAFAIAGGSPGLSGDGGPASAARLRGPLAVRAGGGGAVLVADAGNARVRRISDVGVLPAPRFGRTVSVVPASGTVAVRTELTPRPIVLREPDLTPRVARIDSRRGALNVTVERPHGGVDTAYVRDGVVRLDQPTSGTTTANLRLVEPLRGCRGATGRAAAPAHAAAARRRGPTRRRVRVAVRGRYKTIGRYGTAAASGTRWSMTDYCNRTVVRVTEGKVVVRPRGGGRPTTVRAGQTRVLRRR